MVRPGSQLRKQRPDRLPPPPCRSSPSQWHSPARLVASSTTWLAGLELLLGTYHSALAAHSTFRRWLKLNGIDIFLGCAVATKQHVGSYISSAGCCYYPQSHSCGLKKRWGACQGLLLLTLCAQPGCWQYLATHQKMETWKQPKRLKRQHEEMVFQHVVPVKLPGAAEEIQLKWVGSQSSCWRIPFFSRSSVSPVTFLFECCWRSSSPPFQQSLPLQTSRLNLPLRGSQQSQKQGHQGWVWWTGKELQRSSQQSLPRGRHSNLHLRTSLASSWGKTPQLYHLCHEANRGEQAYGFQPAHSSQRCIEDVYLVSSWERLLSPFWDQQRPATVHRRSHGGWSCDARPAHCTRWGTWRGLENRHADSAHSKGREVPGLFDHAEFRLKQCFHYHCVRHLCHLFSAGTPLEQSHLGRNRPDAWGFHCRCQPADDSRLVSKQLWSRWGRLCAALLASPYIWALQPQFHIGYLAPLQPWDDESSVAFGACITNTDGHHICLQLQVVFRHEPFLCLRWPWGVSEAGDVPKCRSRWCLHSRAGLHHVLGVHTGLLQPFGHIFGWYRAWEAKRARRRGVRNLILFLPFFCVYFFISAFFEYMSMYICIYVYIYIHII